MKKRVVIIIKLVSLEGFLKKGLCEDKFVVFIVIISFLGVFWRILFDLLGSCFMDKYEVRGRMVGGSGECD